MIKVRYCVVSVLAACSATEVTVLEQDGGSSVDATWSLPELRASTGTPPVLAQIGPEGGAFTSSDGRFEVIVPAGTFDQLRTLSIEEASTATAVAARVYRVGPDLPLLGPVLLKYRPREQEWAPSPIAARLQTRTGTTWTHLPWVGHLDRAAIVAAANRLGDFALADASCTGLEEGEANCSTSRVDRCVLDLDTRNGDFCGIPCSSDLECPRPSYCQNGGCFLRPCSSDVLCVREEERCFGAPQAGVCLPDCEGRACLPAACRSDADCQEGEICTSETEGTGGRCIAEDAGCSSRYRSCPVRVWRMDEGFSRHRNQEAGALWLYGSRPEREQVSLSPFQLPRPFPSTNVWRWVNTGDFPAVGKNVGPEDQHLGLDLYPAVGDLILAARTEIERIEHPVVRWSVPYSGHYALSGRVRITRPRGTDELPLLYTARITMPRQGVAHPMTNEMLVGTTIEHTYDFRTTDRAPEGLSSGEVIDFWIELGLEANEYLGKAGWTGRITYLGP
ncbi:MAG: hypothetical protein IPG45_15980 [Deltaproteobacteria bacterium]|nr:hypothetical protein [Deltaproteobacteria bacterium]